MTDNRQPLAMALRWLARREHTRAELSQKLRAKGVMSHEITPVLDQLEAAGAQSDQRFLDVFVTSCVSRARGPLYIQRAVQQKGLSAEMLQIYLKEQAIDWLAIIRKLWLSRFKDASRDRAEQAKQTRFFQSRGFYAEDIYAFYKTLAVENL